MILIGFLLSIGSLFHYTRIAANLNGVLGCWDAVGILFNDWQAPNNPGELFEENGLCLDR